MLRITCVPTIVSDQRTLGPKSSVTYFTLKVLLVSVREHVGPENICLRDKFTTGVSFACILPNKRMHKNALRLYRFEGLLTYLTDVPSLCV